MNEHVFSESLSRMNWRYWISLVLLAFSLQAFGTEPPRCEAVTAGVGFQNTAIPEAPLDPEFSKLLEYLGEDHNYNLMDVKAKPLKTGAESLAAKIAIIDKADHTIDISYYILKADSSGLAIMAALQRAVARGVKVRVLVDGAGSFSATSHQMRALLEDAKNQSGSIEVRVVSPLISVQGFIQNVAGVLTGKEWNFSLNALNRRLHDKIILVDAGYKTSWCIIGGRNISDHYHGLTYVYPNLSYNVEDEYVDYDTLYKSDFATGANDPLYAVTNHFSASFHYRLNLSLSNRLWGALPVNTDYYLGQMENHANLVANANTISDYMNLMKEAAYWETGFDTAKAIFVTEIQNLITEANDFMHRPRFKFFGPRRALSRSVFEFMLRAKKNVTWISPYPLLSRQDLRLINRWLIENPEATFDLGTNSLATTDNIYVYALFRFYVLPMIRKMQNDPRIGSRIRVYLYKSRTLMHAKGIKIDDAITLTTTSNMDARSRGFNSEIGIWDDSPNGVKGIQELFERIKARSRFIGAKSDMDDPNESKVKAALLYYAQRLIRLFKLDKYF